MPTTVKIPLELLTVEVNSGNCFWTAKSGTNLDQSYIAFVDSGRGVATFWGYVPNNLAASPLWSLDAIHTVDSGSGGNVIVSVYGRSTSHTSTIDIAPTLLVSSASISTQTSNVVTYSSLSGGNFDGVVALSATNYLFVKFYRHADSSGDTISAQWNLMSLVLRCDVA